MADQQAAASDITVEQGRLITTEAAAWKGTSYNLVGASSQKGVEGDCSGTTYKIYTAAQFPYAYQSTEVFPTYVETSKLFRKLGSSEAPQDGDILHWPGHMAIYCSFYMDPTNATTERTNKSGTKFTQVNDMWTGTHTDGPPYGPGKISYFKNGAMPDVYRYQKKQ